MKRVVQESFDVDPSGAATVDSRAGQPLSRAAPGSQARARLQRVIRCDGLFEFALGLLLASATLTGLDAALPMDRLVIVVFGVMLLPVGVALFAFARSPSRAITVVLALANAAGALVFLAWLAGGWDTFSPAGQVLVVGTALALGVLPVAEFALFHLTS